MTRPGLKHLLVVSAAFACVAQAPATPPRLRGTISSVDAGTISMTTKAGAAVTVATTSDTKYAGVVRSSIDQLKQGDFIGTAATGPDSALRSTEVVIFPDSMRGAGEGHYPWDSGPASKASSMTNGTVSSMHAAHAASSMTNGTVASRSGQGGTVMLNVTYKGGSSRIVVRPGTPIVAFVPGDASLAKAGAKVFVVTDPAQGKPTARFVAVGQDGVTPPM